MPILINVDCDGGWDEVKEEFLPPVHKSFKAEHSLVAIRKWESKYHKPFLTSDKSREESLYYIQCMTITQNVDPDIYKLISNDEIQKISDYINNPMSATTVKPRKGTKRNHDIQTAETLYATMIDLNIPFDPCEKWHLNQLLKLMEVCADRQQGSQKMSKKDIYAQNKALNNARRARYHTKG